MLNLLTGGRKTQSALYRIRYTGQRRDESTTADSPPADPSAGAATASAAVSWKATLLEQATLPPDKLERVWQSLGDPEPRIRYAARMVIERQPLELWQHRALGETGNPLAAAPPHFRRFARR